LALREAFQRPSRHESGFLPSLLRQLLVQDGIDADAARQVGCEQAVRIESSLDRQEIPVARIDAIELLGRQDLVLGEVNLAAAPDRRVDETVDGRAAGDLVSCLRVELEIKAVAVFGERDQAVVRLVCAQNGRDRRAGRRSAYSQQFDNRFACAGSRESELDGVPARAADEVSRRHSEAGLETEPEEKFGVRGISRQRSQPASEVVETIE